MNLCTFEANLGYRTSFGIARATQRNPVSKNQIDSEKGGGGHKLKPILGYLETLRSALFSVLSQKIKYCLHQPSRTLRVPLPCCLPSS